LLLEEWVLRRLTIKCTVQRLADSEDHLASEEAVVHLSINEANRPVLRIVRHTTKPQT